MLHIRGLYFHYAFWRTVQRIFNKGFTINAIGTNVTTHLITLVTAVPPR